MMNRQTLAVLLATILCASGAGAQDVAAHYAQHLVTETMSTHPELQKLGLHVVPEGKQDEEIIACSVPSKIGKKDSAADLEAVKSGKPAVKTVTDKSFYDLALPLNDAKKQTIGLLVMEMRFSGASSAEDAVHKAEAIRDEIGGKISSKEALYKAAPKTDPLVLIRTTKLPEIVGDFDHFAVNRKANRLYVSAEVHHSIEVFDLKTGEHMLSAPGVTTPHTLAFDEPSGMLLVADGGDNSCRFLDGMTLREKKRIALDAYPDAGYYDEQDRLFYVGNGGKHGNEEYSFVSIVSVPEAKEVGRIRIEANNLEAMALDKQNKRLYVNMRDKAQIAVVDLTKQAVVNTWTIPNLKLNTPMVLDGDNQRLFVAGRQPGKLWILNAADGSVVTSMDTVEKADDMTFDKQSRRIYVTGSGGVSVVHQDDANRYTKMSEFATNEGKTSTLVADLHQFYIIHTKTPLDTAALQLYQVN